MVERHSVRLTRKAVSSFSPGSGPGGRRFKSSLPDQFKPLINPSKSINYNNNSAFILKPKIAENWDHWDHPAIFLPRVVVETGPLETRSAV